MISYLSGKVIAKKPNYVILEVSGVGYKIFRKIEDLKIGSQVNFYIHDHIKEDLHDLYGFKTLEELELFEQLLSVNGVGPKVALNILSIAPENKIKQAISGGSESFFIAMPGIGKKVAAKIILELKSKVAYVGEENTSSGGNEEVCDALISLGFKQSEIIKIINNLPKEIILAEDQIRWCLKAFQSKV